VTRQPERRILAVYAHPDDAEIWSGGTLLAHRKAGDHTAVCVMTHGDGPRAAEARRGAEMLGAQLYHLPFPDRALSVNSTTFEAVAEILHQEQPQIILTHWEGDSHPDHVTTWAIVRSAILMAKAENDLQALYWSDTYNGTGAQGLFTPDCLIDVSDVWEEKLAAIAVHERQPFAHYVEMVTHQCAIHGARGGVRWAEGLRRVPIIGKGRRARSTLWEVL